MAKIAKKRIDLIGNTPLLEIKRYSTEFGAKGYKLIQTMPDTGERSFSTTLYQ